MISKTIGYNGVLTTFSDTPNFWKSHRTLEAEMRRCRETRSAARIPRSELRTVQEVLGSMVIFTSKQWCFHCILMQYHIISFQFQIYSIELHLNQETHHILKYFHSSIISINALQVPPESPRSTPSMLVKGPHWMLELRIASPRCTVHVQRARGQSCLFHGLLSRCRWQPLFGGWHWKKTTVPTCYIWPA